jgi:hypothetical protein
MMEALNGAVGNGRAAKKRKTPPSVEILDLTATDTNPMIQVHI